MDRRMTGRVLAAALVLVAGALVAAAADERQEQVVVKTGSEVRVVELDDLADGEAVEIEVGEGTLRVRREGDRLVVNEDGLPFDLPELDGADGAKRLVVVRTETGDGDDASDAFAWHGELDGDVDVRVLTLDDGGVDVEVERTLPHVLRARAPGAVFRCPVDDATLTVGDDHADEAFTCPICGTTMEKVEREAHVVVVKKKVEEKK